MNRRWVLACAAAEALGMAASAGAARAAGATGVVAGFFLVLVGGLIEGTALGLAQATVLRDRLTRLRPWVLATVLVAGLGWAAGSAPATLAGDTGGTGPPLPLILLGAAGLGLVLGPPRGAAQALVMRNHVRHPWRWVTANALGWALAMPVIFLGASTAGATWPWPATVGYGALTGAVAGAALGAVTGAWLPALDWLSVSDRQGLVAARDEGPSGAGPDAVTATSVGP